MSTIIETIEALNSSLRTATKRDLHRDAKRLTAQRDHLTRKLSWYNATRDRVLAMATDRRKAQEILTHRLLHYGDVEQRLRIWLATLTREGLLTTAQASLVDLRFRDAETEEAGRVAFQESKKLQDLRQEIVASCSDALEARRLYNVSRGPLNEHKLNQWLRVLDTNKLLPKSEVKRIKKLL